MVIILYLNVSYYKYWIKGHYIGIYPPPLTTTDRECVQYYHIYIGSKMETSMIWYDQRNRKQNVKKKTLEI